MKPNAAKPDPVECNLCGNMVPKVVAYPGIEGKVCRACRDELIEEDRHASQSGKASESGSATPTQHTANSTRSYSHDRRTAVHAGRGQAVSQSCPLWIKQAETYIALSRKANVQPIECSTSPD